MKAKFITMVLAILVMSFGISFGQTPSVTLDNVAGGMWHGEPDSIMAGSTYVFSIRLTSISNTFSGITNGFRVYSDDGATWTTAVGDTTGTPSSSNFDLIYAINPADSVTGAGADTIGFGGAALFGGGLVADFNDVAYTITIGPIPPGATHHGQTICLDSAFYPTAGTWKWAGPEALPTWDGPHCYTVIDSGSTDIISGIDGLPLSFSLSQNYPNPFNPTTTIEYSLPSKSDVSLTIYNVTGQKVKEINEPQEAGYHSFEWDASNVASGVYFYKIIAGDFSETKKMMLLK